MSKSSSKEDGFSLGTTMNSIRILASLLAILSTISVLLEVFLTEDGLLYIYILNGFTIAFSIAVIIYSTLDDAAKNITKITHALVLVINISLLLAVFFYPLRFQMNVILLGVFLFLLSLGISWKLLNQVGAVLYSILLTAVLVYFDPDLDMFSIDIIQGSSIFLIFALVSIITGFLVNRFRINVKAEIEKNIVSSEMADMEAGQLVRNQNMYKNFVERSKIGLFNIDSKGDFKFVSESVHIIFGYDSSEDMLKENFFEFFLEEADHKDMVHNIVRKKGKIRNYKAKLKKKNSSRFIANLNVDLITHNESESKFYEGSIEDVTQEFIRDNNLRKEIAELRQEKDQNVQKVLQAKHSGSVKAQFLANMSHEIKTPINSVIGFLNLIEKGMFSSVNELREFAANTRVAVDSLFDIVTNVLDISKIEEGKLELDHIEFNFHSEVAKSKSIITPKAMEKELELNFKISDKIPKKTYGDPTRLRQVMVNLLTNSVKNTDSGEISLTADVIDKSMESVKIKVAVTDTGRGIPEDKLKILFKPYTQVKNNKGTEKEGTGLGLMITKQFVTLMGGKIEIHSDEGIGTTVEFTVVLDLTPTKMPKLSSQKDVLDETIEDINEIIDTKAVEEPVKEEKPVSIDKLDLKQREELAYKPILPKKKEVKPPQEEKTEPQKEEIPPEEKVSPEVETPIEDDILSNMETPAEDDILSNIENDILSGIESPGGDNIPSSEGAFDDNDKSNESDAPDFEEILKHTKIPDEDKAGPGVKPPAKDTPVKKVDKAKKKEILKAKELLDIDDDINITITEVNGTQIKFDDEDESDLESDLGLNKAKGKPKIPSTEKPKEPKKDIPPVSQKPPEVEEPPPVEEPAEADDQPEIDELGDLNLGLKPVVKKSGKKVLLVEDNPISQKVERKILVEFGYDVVTVSNGREAIEAVQKEYYNVILMDIQMSDMDGIAATKKIRSLDEPINKIPIIAVTAHSSMKDREMCLASGMDDYIAKPINANFLRMTIEQWINREHYD